jgi:hypothetical protein
MKIIRCVATAAFVAVLAAGTAAQGSGDREVAQRFSGAWRLASWTETLSNGTKRPAATDVGNIMFSESGRMCAVLASSTRPKWTGAPASIEDAVARTSGFITYCAQVEFHAEGFVVYTDDLDFNPRSVGAVRKRWFTFDGPDRLTLSIDKAELASGVQSSVLVWERARGR